MNKRTKTIIWIVVAVVAVMLVGILLSDVLGGGTELNYTQLMKALEEGKINQLYVDGYAWEGYFVVDGKITAKYYGTAANLYEFGALEALRAQFPTLGIELADPNAGSVWSSLMPLLGVVLVAVMFWLIMRSAAGGGNASMSINKTKAHVQNNLKVRFSDVAGAEEEKEELAEVVDFLKSPKKFSALGARIPSGVLLVGPPGTGKTLFAKAVAGEAGVPFFSVSGSDFVEMYVGVGAKRVRDLFDMAKKNQPCIIFIDEIDAVGRRRGAGLAAGTTNVNKR